MCCEMSGFAIAPQHISVAPAPSVCDTSIPAVVSSLTSPPPVARMNAMARTAPLPDDADDRPDVGIDRGVEHLQAAAHEMLAAARSFLDVVEEVVADREKLAGVAASVTDMLGSAGGSLARLADRVAGSSVGDAVDVAASPARQRVRRIDVD